MNRNTAGFLTIPTIELASFTPVPVDLLYLRLLQKRGYVHWLDIPNAGIAGPDDITTVNDIP